MSQAHIDGPTLAEILLYSCLGPIPLAQSIPEGK